MNAGMRTQVLPASPRAKLTLRLVLGVYVALSALNAQAAPSGVAPAFGNTVISTYPDGRSQRIWISADGTWEGVNRRGKSIGGRWTVNGQKVCLRQTRPPTLPISYCTHFPEDSAPGVQWSSKDLQGTPIQLTLHKGIVGR